MVVHCPRCGSRFLSDPRFCAGCMDGEADPDRARQIVEAAAQGQPDALRMLASIDDTRAASALLEAAGHPHPEVRRASLTSLGLIGDRRAMPVAIGALGGEDDGVRRAAIECLAELGGSEAADALAAHLADGVDVVEAAMALAWLKDARAFEPLVAALEHREFSRNLYRSTAFGLSWLGERAVPPLANHLERLADEWVAAAEADPARPAWPAQMLAASAGEALLRIGGDEAGAAVQRAKERFGGLPLVGLPLPEHRPFAFRVPPDDRRTVPRWSLELTPATLPVREQITKFGGQPVWIDMPIWPLAADGGPMTFMAQFAVPGVEGMAYLFIDPSDPSEIDYSDAGSFGCLIMQPGPPPGRFIAEARGPTYASEVGGGLEGFVRRPHWRMIEYVPTLEPGFEYPDWEPLQAEPPGDRDDDRDWNKIGGTPRYLQGGPADPGRWRFLFQFTAAAVGRELADGAECYGFIDEERRGLFLAESH